MIDSVQERAVTSFHCSKIQGNDDVGSKLKVIFRHYTPTVFVLSLVWCSRVKKTRRDASSAAGGAGLPRSGASVIEANI